jgi:anhydro-N-acetylmuramic acid kinase
MVGMGNQRNIFLGLMSGTSADGIDVVAARIDGPRVETLGHLHCPYDPSLRQAVLALMTRGPDEIERAGELSVALGHAYADAIEALIAGARLDRHSIAAVGVHGQTIRHRPERGFTVQLNHPALIAERTGLTVVADFRSRDVAAGGQGAPLVPAFHAAVFTGTEPRAVVNVGGIANVTLLPSAGAAGPVTGFDTGPGNCLLDLWCERHTGRAYDAGGAWAARGDVLAHLLEAFLADPYFTAPPPKSTGREYFNADWLERKLRGLALNAPLRPEDVQATLVALTARSILAATVDRPLYVCGGGVANAVLMAALGPRARSTAVLGVDPQQVEALAFAWLAARCLNGQPGNLPAVTGAAGPRVLGAIYPASSACSVPFSS